ncbi:MAG TPA: DinB family protein [Candidatus Eisenbacteria bacterium]|nr:DinB family protein [Candidatus Eisenbacteria bacterium]
MSGLSEGVRDAFASEYRARAAELHKWVDPLSEEQFWRNPFSHGNSAGHLVLHLTGNLSYYIGARIAESGYIRNRDLEFSDSRKPPMAEVLQEFDETIALVISTIETQSESDWTAPYTAERDTVAKNRLMLFLRCASHLYHHIGQIIYLARELQKS